MADLKAALALGQPVDRGLLSDQVSSALAEAITAGHLQPGQRLVESEIARQFSISQAPVREALKRLAHRGMVLQLPRRGSFVAMIDEQEARRAYKVRAPLEEVAASEFCQNAEEAVCESLASLVTEMHTAAASDDLGRFIETDIAFHRTVWEATGNDLLIRIWPMMEGSLRAFTSISNRLYFRSLAEIAQTHEPLVSVLRKRDAETAGTLFREHVANVWHRVDERAKSSAPSKAQAMKNLPRPKL